MDPITSPAPQPPTFLSRRAFSFAPEFYTTFRAMHGLIRRVFLAVFPNPLAVSRWALRRARLRGAETRGSEVAGPSGVGRLVGRHPITRTPVVAWNQEAYPAMCEAFDREHAARIVAWQAASQRLGLSSEENARWALRIDQGLNILGLLCTLAAAGFGLLTSGLGGLVVGIIVGAMASLVLIMVVAVLGLGMAAGIGMIGAAGVGLWASAGARRARVSDEAGRTSAAAIVAAMQAQVVQPQPQPQPQPSVQLQGEEGRR